LKIGAIYLLDDPAFVSDFKSKSINIFNDDNPKELMTNLFRRRKISRPSYQTASLSIKDHPFLCILQLWQTQSFIFIEPRLDWTVFDARYNLLNEFTFINDPNQIQPILPRTKNTVEQFVDQQETPSSAVYVAIYDL